MADPSKLHAMINARCPHCHEGRLFKYKWWNLLNFAQMHENCPHCDVRYEVEPGFFYGAMYISYAFTVGIMLFGGIIVFNFFLNFFGIHYASIKFLDINFMWISKKFVNINFEL